MANFKDLSVWQKSIQLVSDIYRISKNFPKEEVFGITSQIRRACISIPSNIAEGNGRRSKADYIQFLKIARGSCSEVETQIIICHNLHFINDIEFENLNNQILEISKMLNGLINYLSR